MTDHGHDFGIHQFLRYGGALFRISTIVLADQSQFHFFTTDDQITFGIDFVDGQLSAVFIVFTNVRNPAGFRLAATDFDANLICCQFAARTVGTVSRLATATRTQSQCQSRHHG